MKKVSKMISVISTLGLLIAARIATVQAGPFVHELGENHFIRVTIPGDKIDQVKMAYEVDGNEKNAKPGDGEIVSLSIQDNNLNELAIPFVAYRAGDDLVIMVGDPDAESLKPTIGFHSTLETQSLDKSSNMVFTIPGGKAEVVYSAGNPQEQFSPVDNDFPMVLDETYKNFSMDGTLNIKFFVKAAPLGVDQSDSGTDDGVDPGQPATGGCNFSGLGVSGPMSAWLWTVLAFPLVMRLRQSKRIK